MLVNFCNPVLKPVITCSGVCHEGHDIQNLVSNDPAERQRGYLGYGSPPTFITIQFFSHVNIKHIVISPQVRSKKSQGFEIFSKCTVKNKHSSQQQNTANNGPSSQDDDFEKVGFTILNDSDCGVIFYNNNCKAPSDLERNFACKALFRNFSVRNTNCIRIKIFKAVLSVPAMGRIEVWGEPGRSCSRSIKNYIYKLWHQQDSSFQSNANDVNTRTSGQICHSSLGVDTTVLNSEFEEQPPEEFVDPISCKIMVLPFILPSGKVVDLETLENHKHFEAMNGRQPSDPFTGIRFTQDSIPIPDHDLKRRIDRFLSENCHKKEFQNIPRTTGTKPKSRTHQEKGISFVNPPSEFNHHKFKSMTSNTIGSFRSNQSCNYNESVGGKLTDQNVLSTESAQEVGRIRRVKNDYIVDNSNDKVHVLKRTSEIVEIGIDLPVIKRSKEDHASTTLCSSVSNMCDETYQKEFEKKSHEQLLDESLNSALKSALQGLPSFVKYNSTNVPCVAVKKCDFCDKSEMLFIVPCKHLVCRTCLTSKIRNRKLYCHKCQVFHPSCDVERYHS